MRNLFSSLIAVAAIAAAELAGTKVTAQNLSYPAPVRVNQLADTFSTADRTHRNITDATMRMGTKAYNWSKYSMAVPIVAGVVVWKLQKPKHLVDYDSYGNVIWDRFEDPDRTLPILLACGGVIVGPSVGYFVGGCPGRGTAGLLIRMGVAGLTYVGAQAAARAADTGGWDGLSAAIGTGIMVGTVGAGIVLALAGNDFAHIKEVVRQAHEKKLKGAIGLSPQMLGSGHTLGLRLTVTL